MSDQVICLYNLDPQPPHDSDEDGDFIQSDIYDWDSIPNLEIQVLISPRAIKEKANRIIGKIHQWISESDVLENRKRENEVSMFYAKMEKSLIEKGYSREDIRYGLEHYCRKSDHFHFDTDF